MARAARRRTTQRKAKPTATRTQSRTKKKLGRGKSVATGIDIGTFSVKLVTLYGDDAGNLDIRKVTVVPLEKPEGAEYAEELLERQKEALKRAVKQHGKLEGTKVLGFPRNRVTVRYLNLPSANPSELKEMLTYDVERHVPFSIDELELSFQIIERLGEHESRIMMVCAPRKEIEPYLSMCQELGIEIDRIDMDVMGDAASYSRFMEPDETVAIVNFGRSSVNLSIVQNHYLLFSRSMPVSEDKLLSGFPGARTWRDLQGRVTAAGALNPQEREHFSSWVDKLSIELLRSLSACACDEKTTKVDRLILCGGAGYFPAGPPRGLSLKIKTNITVEPPLNGELPSSEAFQGTEICTSAGLALLGLKKETACINLLPEDFIQKRDQENRSAFRKNVAILVFMILTLLGGTVYLYGYEKYLQLNQLETFYKERLVLASGLNKKQKELTTVETYLNKNHSCLNVIHDVLKILPPKAYLSSITFTKRKQLELNGQVETDQDFQKFYDALIALSPEGENESYFMNTKWDTSVKQLPLGSVTKKVVQFNITCFLRWEEPKKSR